MITKCGRKSSLQKNHNDTRRNITGLPACCHQKKDRPTHKKSQTYPDIVTKKPKKARHSQEK